MAKKKEIKEIQKEEEKSETESQEVKKDLEKNITEEDKKLISSNQENKESEEKPELEREYIVNLRKEVIKVPRYRRAKKAIRALKEFLARHMKVEKRNIERVKIDKYLNEEIWYRGIKKPLTKVKVKAKKIKGIVYVELAEMPKILEFKKKKEEKFKQASVSSIEKKIEEKAQKKEDIETKEKETSTIEAGLEKQKKEAKEIKHQIKEKHKRTMPVRKALQK
ncbi:MAG: 50S ribosomal protein L31e [Candidatus Pacearchaeota archaeon]